MNEDDNYEWLPEAFEEWSADQTDIEGRLCRQPNCGRPAVAVMFRRRYRNGFFHRARWGCCDNPDHLYGRRVVNGRVESRYLKGSIAHQRALERVGAAR